MQTPVFTKSNCRFSRDRHKRTNSALAPLPHWSWTRKQSDRSQHKLSPAEAAQLLTQFWVVIDD